jgi:hypothetical protein
MTPEEQYYDGRTIIRTIVIVIHGAMNSNDKTTVLSLYNNRDLQL